MRSPRPFRAAIARFAFRGLIALTVTIGLSRALTAMLHATETPAGTEGISAPAPPHLPDSYHVINGCHLSALAYLARFAMSYPQETGAPVLITLLNADGVRRRHTVALVTWNGGWWCRDEFYGVICLHEQTHGQTDLVTLANAASRLLERRARRAGRTNPAPRRDVCEGWQAVHLAARAIPFPSRAFRLCTNDGELGALVFRPGRRQVAVYIPRHGTCLAECAVEDDADAVALVAAQLGYTVSAITPVSPLR
jgi:hypothetical protein